MFVTYNVHQLTVVRFLASHDCPQSHDEKRLITSSWWMLADCEASEEQKVLVADASLHSDHTYRKLSAH